MTSLYLLTASLLACASAGASRAVVEHLPEVPDSWTASGDALDPNKAISFSIALAQPALANLPGLLTAVGSKHLTRDEAHALRAPLASDVDSVLQWLTANGVDASHEHDWIKVKTTVGQAQKLLDADLRHYTYDDKAVRVRTTKYTVPEHLSDAISFIHPIANFMAPVRRSAGGKVARRSLADGVVTPSALHELYNINYVPATNASSPVRFGVAGYLGQDTSHNDTDQFLRQEAPAIAATKYNFTVELVNGGRDPEAYGYTGGEAQLDIEYAAAIGFPTNITFYSTGGRATEIGDDGKPKPAEKAENEPYVDLLEYLLAKSESEIPHVLSTSYGDDELTVPLEYAKRVCDLYGLLSKRGVSIIHSSGDGGSAGGQPGNCRTKDGKHKKILMPTFPSSCPWVTSVGSTTYSKTPEGSDFSSGGFSQYFTRESWQVSATDAYVRRLGKTLSGYYNATGRGIPDISAVGEHFRVITDGEVDNDASGTSASTPLFAALIALVNDARLRQGKPSLGFLNAALYSSNVTSVLRDITVGTSIACDFAKAGWPSKKGWDAVTGLGAPKDFQKLLDVLVAW